MSKSGSANRFERIWNVSTDENTGKHVEVAIKKDFTGVDWVFINCYQCRGNTENPTGISFENADQFKWYDNLKICSHDTSALLKCMPNLFEDKADIIISTRGNISGRQFVAYVDIYDDKIDFVIGKKEGGCWGQQLRFTTSEFQKLQNQLPEVLACIGINEPMEH